MKYRQFLFIFLLHSLYTGAQTTSQSVNLFNGKDLTGWVSRGGIAKFSVENGMIVGTTIMNTGNTFLVTEKEYGDFVLEADVMVEDNEGNSGIQTRSHFDPAGNNGN